MFNDIDDYSTEHGVGMFRCKHKYGAVQDDYQYCEKCGEAKAAPAKVCSHHWVRIETINSTSGPLGAIGYVLECTNCGTLKNHEV